MDFIRIATASPALRVADVQYNIENMCTLATQAREAGVQIVLFPELCVTAYSCADLFRQSILLETAEEGVASFVAAFQDWEGILVFGAPIAMDGRIYNCAIVAQDGKICGIVPKTHIPGNNEYYEPRWFSPAMSCNRGMIVYAGFEVPIGADILFPLEDEPNAVIGIEICEDLWMPVPPSSLQARAGATILMNLSASNELVGKADYRRSLVLNQSARCLGIYAYASANPGESTTDTVFGGHMLIAEGGHLLAESSRFETAGTLLIADVDVDRMAHDRQNMGSFHQTLKMDATTPVWRSVFLELACTKEDSLFRKNDSQPFVPQNPAVREARCQEILAIQTAGLAKRLIHTGLKRLVVGVSGGLDSTLALIVAARTMDRLHLPRENVLAVTMPGFGTTDRTYQNALALIESLNAEKKEIPIVEASLLHFRDIGHDPKIHNVTYENVQARERTQILMDLSNLNAGLLVGTGDLSELALGWCTYNGDHMSMYAVNTGVPKTLVQYLVGWYADHEAGENSKHILLDILATPISPELLPPGENGEIEQKTEDVIGPYLLHDFFLFHFVRYGAEPRKILRLACDAFAGTYEKHEIKKWLQVFIRRFFSQQFKRSCLPDGPKVGTISLSPRADWRMPSDASAALWLADLERSDES